VGDKQREKKKESELNETNRTILQKIKAIKAEHPLWGYRRVTAWLRHREGIKVNRKRIYKLMKESGLLVRCKIYKARRKPKAERPLQFWGIDMTKFMIEGLGWAYLVIVLDWFTKEIVGFDISLRSKTENWLKALEMGLNKKFEAGVVLNQLQGRL
jgi:transposase InsO family protein